MAAIAQILTLLNKDLSLEYSAAIQYAQHYGLITGPEYMAIRSQFEEHAKQELDHALTLSDLISYYGGVPTAEIGKINVSSDIKKMLELNAINEEGAIMRYRTRIKQCEEAGVYELAEELRSIIKDELDHANDLKLALRK